LEILNGIKAETCAVTGTIAVDPPVIDMAIALCVAEMEKQASPEVQLAIANGKIEGMEFALNALTRQK